MSSDGESIQILYLGKNTNTTLYKYSTTSKDPTSKSTHQRRKHSKSLKIKTI